mmetsp:Transcript_22063/g.45950  ORF Transcript_22063/g.45950 Transcript_22063/m.45950 type:complete len:170 (-) Transcript_22063:1462-1971(-)
MAPSAIELLENLIADLEGKLNLAPGADLLVAEADKGIGKPQTQKTKQNSKKKQPNNENKNSGKKGKNDVDENIPEICKLEFKVGLITKVWVHPDADKLYCEEIDCGEEGGPRQIASGLRLHYSEEEMLGKRVLVVANLKAKKSCRLQIPRNGVVCSGNQRRWVRKGRIR